jgi:hypothetical protein
MRTTLIPVIAGLTATTLALAASVHLKPPNRNPTFADNVLILNAAGAIAGLGNGDVVVGLTAQADVKSTCTNQGGNVAPGQNPAPLTVTGAQIIPEDELKNGTTPFNVSTQAPVTPIAGAPGCPNPTWTESIDDLAFTSGVITVEQPAGVLVLTVSCKFSPPTGNGAVPATSVSCTVS